MDVIDALRMAVQHYPGGIEALAPRLAKSPSTLQKELREAPGFKLGARDALAIAALCCDLGSMHGPAYATSVADACSLHVSLKPADTSDVGCLIAGAGAAMVETGQFTQAVVRLAGDGDVSANDLAEMRREGHEAIDAIQRNIAAAERAHLSGQRTASSESQP